MRFRQDHAIFTYHKQPYSMKRGKVTWTQTTRRLKQVRIHLTTHKIISSFTRYGSNRKQQNISTKHETITQKHALHIFRTCAYGLRHCE